MKYMRESVSGMEIKMQNIFKPPYMHVWTTLTNSGLQLVLTVTTAGCISCWLLPLQAADCCRCMLQLMLTVTTAGWSSRWQLPLQSATRADSHCSCSSCWQLPLKAAPHAASYHYRPHLILTVTSEGCSSCWQSPLLSAPHADSYHCRLHLKLTVTTVGCTSCWQPSLLADSYH